MALGTIQINRLNLMQGPIDEIERHFLFIGTGTTNQDTLLSVGVETDLDEALGKGDSTLKTQVTVAMQNAGQNWGATVLPVADGADWGDAMDFAMENISCEAIVITEPVTAGTSLEAMQTKAAEIMAQYMRPVFFMAAVRGIEAGTETWANYITAMNAIPDGIAADRMIVVPYLWKHTLGTLAGRLCNRSVTVADSPMRVATGALLGSWSEKPKDSAGVALTLAHLKSLDAARFSVPQWYPDFDGMYWGDGNTLDVNGGDYQVIENLRVVQKAMRRIYPLSVARIANRRLNSTPVSIAENKTYFMRPLRGMAKSANIMGLTFPGEIHPPTDGSITIVWLDRLLQNSNAKI